MRYATEAGLSVQTRFNLHSDLLHLQILWDRERKKIKQEIKDEILKEIKVNADASDAIKEIDGLQKALDKLKGGK